MNLYLTPPLLPVHFPHFSGCPPCRPASQCGGDGAMQGQITLWTREHSVSVNPPWETAGVQLLSSALSKEQQRCNFRWIS